MKVRDLIKALRSFPADDDVVVWDGHMEPREPVVERMRYRSNKQHKPETTVSIADRSLWEKKS